MAIDKKMTASALLRAQTHVKNVCSQGQDFTIIRPASSSAKDEFGAITSASTKDLKAHPVRFSPYDREVTQRITWAVNVDILCYASKLAIDDLDITLKQLKNKYTLLRHDGLTYDIRYIEYYSAFFNDFLYIIFGGTK